MSRVTKFAARDPGPSARMAGFFAHLRDNGLRLGVAESQTALTALTHVEAAHPDQARQALRAICTGCAEDSARFDDLFNAYWLNGGRVSQKSVPVAQQGSDTVHSSRDAKGQGMADSSGAPTAPDGGEGEAERDGEGKLVSSMVKARLSKDLRDLVRPEDIAEAERVAHRLGAALRDRRSRRRRAARKGDQIHFRKLIRQSLSTGGEPLHLPRKQRPDRPLKIVSICDVSGSMTVYSRVFLSFVSGLMRADDTTDAYLFHTHLVRIADALRDKDAIRAMGRLSLLANGYGGGSRIGASLKHFARTYARRFVDGRTVVLILSDGYDTGAPDAVGDALALLKKRGCKIIWLNPLKGWNDYAPVARGMTAALPHLDLFAAANTLDDLAALEAGVGTAMTPAELTNADIAELAQNMRARGETFAIATVIRTAGSTAARPGAKALLDASGTILSGWIGGGCVRGALKSATGRAVETGAPQLISLRPQDLLDEAGVAPGTEVDGARFARNGCPSKGSLDVFVELVSPLPELIVFGASPVAQALSDLARGFQWHVTVRQDDEINVANSNARRMVVIATQGKGDLTCLRAALEMQAEFVAFVGSRRKFRALSEKLLAEGLPKADLEAVQAPAGLPINAVTPEEIALSILAQLTHERRKDMRAQVVAND